MTILTRRTCVRTVRPLLAATLGACFWCSGCGTRRAESGGTTILSVWHVWGGTVAEGFQKLVAAFEKEHPKIRVNLVFAANDLATNQKYFSAVAAGTPPDVIFVDGPQVASWAEWGALEPLTKRVQAAGIREQDYFPPCWRQNSYQGNVWAMTFCADPNFGFVWNKEAFRKAGLDPDRPPKTMAELDACAEKLTRVEDGEITAIGLIPWAQYGGANSMYTWGWAFGGEFFDAARKRVTATDPKVVKALDWMCSYAKKYDVTKIASLQQGFGAAEQNPFYTGKVSLMCLHIGGIAEIERYAPNLDYGVGFLPASPGGEAQSSWVGGWCIGLARGARHQQAGWEFIRWLSHDDEGTTLVGRETGLFPGRQDSPYFDEIKDKPHYGDYLRILQACKHQRPVMPVQAFYMRQLQRAVDNAIYGKKTPQQALQDAEQKTQAELDMVRAGQRAEAGS